MKMIHAHTSLTDVVAELRASERFLNWKPEPKRRVVEGQLPDPRRLEQAAEEKHYTPQELAEMWAVSVQTIREIFQNEEGVLKIGRDGTRTRRRYKTLRIPESVAERVHTRLSA